MPLKFQIVDEEEARTLALLLKGSMTRSKFDRRLKQIKSLPRSIPFPSAEFFCPEGVNLFTAIVEWMTALPAYATWSPRRRAEYIMHDVGNGLALECKAIKARIRKALSQPKEIAVEPSA